MRSKIILVVGLLLLVSAYGQTQGSSSVYGTLSDQGKPFSNGLVVLERLKNERCARIRESNNPSPEAVAEGRACVNDLPWIHTDEKGGYSYQHLEAGWYDIRFLWLMSEPPRNGKQLVCRITDWMVSFEPEKDHTGKYNGFTQGRPFEIKENEAKEINFDYHGQITAGPNCATTDGYSVPHSESGIPDPAQLSIPGVKGVLELAPGPTEWQWHFVPLDQESRLQAMARADHLLITAFLQKVSFEASAEKCRDIRCADSLRRIQNPAPKNYKFTPTPQ